MNNIAKQIKEILIHLAVNDKLPTDMTTLDEDLFSEVLSPQNLMGELRDKGIYIDTTVTIGVVDDALSNINEFREDELILTDDEKADYFTQLQDELDVDNSRISTIIDMVEKNILEDYEDE